MHKNGRGGKRMIENESGEDYLETILRLSGEKGDIHSVEVARELHVSKPAVTKAMRLLTAKGYVKIVGNHIHLTEEGETYARKVYEKHRILTEFLMRLGVDAKSAETDACRMEHLVSAATFEAIQAFMQKN